MNRLVEGQTGEKRGRGVGTARLRNKSRRRQREGRTAKKCVHRGARASPGDSASWRLPETRPERENGAGLAGASLCEYIRGVCWTG